MNEKLQTEAEQLSGISIKELNSSLNMAISSFVLGILSIALSIFLYGGLCGFIGLIICIVYFVRKKSLCKSLMLFGFVFCLVGIFASISFGIYYFIQYRSIQNYVDSGYSQSYEKWIGAEAPDFSVKDINGNEITLSDFKGKRVILDFWATWCPPCREGIPHFIKLRNEFDENELVIIGISSEDKHTLLSFTKKNKINYTIAIESGLPSPYNDIVSIPTTFFIDRKGIIQQVLEGYHDFDDLKHYAELPDYVRGPNELEETDKQVD